MYNLLPGTIEAIRGQTFFQAANWSQVPCRAVASKINAYWDSHNEVKCETEALKFYTLNHALSLIAAKRHPQEILPEAEYKLASAYATESADIAKRLMYYTLLIITRESRHLYQNPSFLNGLTQKYGAIYTKFNAHIHGKGSIDVAKFFCESPPEMSIGQYVTAVVDVFNNGGFGSSFGGKPWGNIAEAARKVIYGETTFEMFVDTAWTLCHNGGPMFNKGMLYHGWTPALYKILDVQRSGQIPQLINSGDVGGFVDGTLKNYVSQGVDLFPNDFSGNVDWVKVTELGALHGNYAVEKAKQAKATKPSVPPIPESKKFYVMPDIYAVKWTRPAAALGAA